MTTPATVTKVKSDRELEDFDFDKFINNFAEIEWKIIGWIDQKKRTQ